MLTIIIPTYNRQSLVLANVRLLLPQVQALCRLIVLDNHSDVPVQDILQSGLPSESLAKVEVIRHRANLGAGANVLRCFELLRYRVALDSR